VKLTKTTWIALVVGILLIGGIFLFTNVNQQSSQKQNTEKELALAKQKLASLDNDQLLTQRDGLKKQLADLSTQSTDIKTRLRFSLDSINITDKIIKDAADCQVDLLEISTPGQGVESLGGIVYHAMNLTIKAKGTTANIAEFVYSLKKVFPTGVIKSLTLDANETAKAPAVASDNNTAITDSDLSNGGATPENTNSSLKDKRVQIILVIYSYSGE
jgi:hypothetical protein